MTDTILADIPKEGADPFKDTEKKTPSESPTEKESKDDGEKDKPEGGDNTPPEDNVPFHQHPRWIERENKFKELEEKYELTAKELADLRTIKDQISQRETTSKVPDWFVDTYGEDQNAWAKYQERQKEWEDQFERRFFEKIEAKQRQQQEETQKWNKWVDDEVNKLVVDPEVKFDPKDKNELIKIMLDWRPTDENGNFNFRKGFEIYQMKKLKESDPAHSDARKKLADAATKTSRGEQKPKDFLTAKELRNKSWNELM